MTITETGTVIPETAADKYTVGNLAYAAAVSPRWPVSVRLAVAGETSALLDGLELYEALESDQIHPASEYSDLAGHAEAKHEALERAAQAVADLTGELLRLFPACTVTAESEAAA